MRKHKRAVVNTAARDRRIVRRYDAGETLEGIGASIKLSRERVRQIVAKAGHSRPRGWRRAVRQERAAGLYHQRQDVEYIAKQLRVSRHETRSLLHAAGVFEPSTVRLYGLDAAQYQRLATELPSGGQIQRAYKSHRTRVQRLGESWAFTLRTWWQVWNRSGHWKESISLTRAWSGYVMTRIDAEGSWSTANVQVVRMREVRRQYAKHPHSRAEAYLLTNRALADFKSQTPDAHAIMLVYRQCRATARLLGQLWTISLRDWWRVWERSGHWPERGAHGYGMHRVKPHFGWRANNVTIRHVAM